MKCWIARGVFAVALVTWLQLAFRSTRQPESWAASRKRTDAFIVMVAAGMLAFPTPNKPVEGEEETF